MNVFMAQLLFKRRLQFNQCRRQRQHATADESESNFPRK